MRFAVRNGVLVPVELAQPMFVCRICHEQIPMESPRAQVDHVARCAEEHRETLEALSPVRRLAAWNQPLDPEWEAHNQALKKDGQNPEVQFNRGRRSNIRRASEH